MNDNRPVNFFADRLRSRMARAEKWFTRVKLEPSKDAEHALSTSLRRLLVADKITREFYGRRFIKKKLRDKLRSFRNVLGRLRDLREISSKLFDININNVFVEKFSAYIEEETAASEREFKHALEKFDNTALYACALPERLEKITLNPPSRNVEEYLEYLLQDVMRAAAGAVAARDDTGLHRVRVLYKRYRYAVEFFQPGDTGRFTKKAKDLREVQTVLGTAHDWLVLLFEARDFEDGEDEKGRDEFLKRIAEKSRSAHDHARKFSIRELSSLSRQGTEK